MQIIANDGYATDTTTLTIIVDTLKQTTEHTENLITTLGEEFVFQLSQQKIKKHNILKGPENLRITNKGQVHWIPLPTQIGQNELTIELQTAETT